MTNQTAAGIAVLVLAHGLTGCGGSDPSPSAPSPVSQPAPPSYTLSGTVFGVTPTGLVRPVEGAMIQINMIKPGTTDANGFYSIPGLTLTGLAPNVAIGNFNTVTAWKPSYVNDTRTLTVSGDTRLDIQLMQRPTFTLSGVVSEMTASGLAPIEGVQIDNWSCDPVFPGNRLPTPSDGCSQGLSDTTTTDKSGRYSISGVYASHSLVCASKEGYQDNMPESECGGYAGSVTVDGDTQFDIQLVRR